MVSVGFGVLTVLLPAAKTVPLNDVKEAVTPAAVTSNVPTTVNEFDATVPVKTDGVPVKVGAATEPVRTAGVPVKTGAVTEPVKTAGVPVKTGAIAAVVTSAPAVTDFR